MQATSLTLEQIEEYLEIMHKKIFLTKTYEELAEIKKKTDLSMTQSIDFTNSSTENAKKVDLTMIREAENLSVEQM